MYWLQQRKVSILAFSQSSQCFKFLLCPPRYDLQMLIRSGLYSSLRKLSETPKILKRQQQQYLRSVAVCTIQSKETEFHSADFFRVTVPELCFTDVLLYVAQKQTLRRFLKSFNLDAGMEKSFFPYGKLRGLKSLQIPLTKLRYRDFRADLGREMKHNELDADHRHFRRKYRYAAPCDRQNMIRPQTGRQIFMELQVPKTDSKGREQVNFAC